MPLVPDVHRPGPVLALGDLALELCVLQRVILDVHGERALATAQRHASRQRPARKCAVALEPQVVVQAPCEMTLDDEDRGSAPPLRGRLLERLGRAACAAFRAVLVEVGHRPPLSRLARAIGAAGCNVPPPPIVVCALIEQRHLVRVTTMGAVK